MAGSISGRSGGGTALVLSREEDVLKNQLLEVLPRPPVPGLSKQQTLDLLFGEDDIEVREIKWQRVYRVIQKLRRMQENRVPGIPIIINTGRTNREPRYQYMGVTGEDGEPLIFAGAIQLEHARVRRLRDLRTRATSASELLAMNYFVKMIEAVDAGRTDEVKKLSQQLAQESLFILPVMSLLGQMVGVPYPQARPLGELVDGFHDALTGNAGYNLMLGKPVERLQKSFKNDWPKVERALAQLINQLVGHAVLKRGVGNVRAELAARAEAAAHELAEGSPDFVEEEG